MELYSRLTFLVACLIALTIASGCTTTTTMATGSAAEVAHEKDEQTRLALKTRWNRLAKLDRLIYPIRKANTDLCGNQVRNMIGIRFSTAWHFKRHERAVARELLSLSDRYAVLGVTPGSPAEAAGIRRGDTILAIDGKFTPVVKGAIGKINRDNTLNRLLDSAAADGEVRLQLQRDGNFVSVTVVPELLCSHPLVLIEDSQLNAFADGKSVYITTGMVRFTESDAELQTVLAHELAHNTEKHIRKREGNALLGGLVAAAVVMAAGGAASPSATDFVNTGVRIGEGAFSRDFEREADYVSLYMLERASIDASESSNLWRRMAIENSAAIRYGATHPTTAERFINLNAVHQEIRDKRAVGLPLDPNRRKDQKNRKSRNNQNKK